MELNKVNGELTELFTSLSSMPDQIKSTDIDLLGSFLMKVYQQNSKRDISLDIFRRTNSPNVRPSTHVTSFCPEKD